VPSGRWIVRYYYYVIFCLYCLMSLII